MNKNAAIKAIRHGVVAASVSAVLTALLVSFAIAVNGGDRFEFFNSAWNYIDSLIILACAYGMYKKSIVAWFILFIHFIAGSMIVSIETGLYGIWGLVVIFLYFYAKAIQGLFVYHKLERQENSSHRATTKWTYLVGLPAFFLMASLMSFGLLYVSGVIPSNKVELGSEIKARDVATLVKSGVISADDKVEYYYFDGLFSILEGGSLLTRDKVISYWRDKETGLKIFILPVKNITEVTLEESGDDWSDSVYKVSTNSPELWLRLYLTIEKKGDRKFIEALRKKLSR